MPFTANISGIATPIASPPNAVAIGFLQQDGHTIHFLNWMLMAAPLALGLTLVTWLVLWYVHPPATPALRIEHVADSLAPRGWFVVGVFAVTVFLWMSDQWHGLPPAVVALLPAVALTTTSIFTRADLALIEWNVLILIAGGISLGTDMQLTGLDHVIVQWLPATGENPFALFAVLVLATLVVGTFMSNTAAANLFLPIGISSAATAGTLGGLHPIHVAVSIALVASMGMALPVSTPPNAMAYARNEFTTRDMVRVSLLISAVGAAAIIFGGEWIMRMSGVLR